MGGGFALIATVILSTMVVLVVMGLLSLALSQSRRAASQRHQEQARANARFALSLAVGQLQKELGPDQRVSATGDLLKEDGKEATGREHWTAVWDSRWQDGGPVLVRDDLTGGLRDRRVEGGWDREESVREWLVSPVEYAQGEQIELVGPGSVGEAAEEEDRVRVPLVPVPGEDGVRGALAWWTGDLGVKANVAVADPWEGREPDPDDPGGGTWFPLMASQEADLASLVPPGSEAVDDPGSGIRRRMVNDRTIDLALDRRWRQGVFHHATVHSRGVLADVREGGLKRNLTAFLEGDGDIDSLGENHPGLADDDRLVGPPNAGQAERDAVNWSDTRHRHTAPRFGVLRDWAQSAVAFSGEDVEAVPPKVEDSPRVEDAEELATSNFSPAAIASMDRHSLNPVLVEGTVGFTMSWYRTPGYPQRAGSKPFHRRIHIYPRVVLWNPYNVQIRLEPTMAMIQGNGRQEIVGEAWRPHNPANWDGNMATLPMRASLERFQIIWMVGGRSSDFDYGGDETGSAGYKDPYVGCFYFALEETVFEPGECLVFSPAAGGAYIQAPDEDTGDGMERNLLSCRVAPDPSRNFHIDDHAMDWIPWRYRYESTKSWGASGIKNQADDQRVILKRLGSATGVTYEDFDRMPQIAVVSQALQFGAGREPRISWNRNEQMTTEQTDALSPVATIVPNVRTREGIRLRWFDEHQSNKLNSGALADTPHFEEALFANWNLRGAYATRTPYDNVAGTLPRSGSAGGPWFFGAYTRDLPDWEVSWHRQTPVPRDGKFHGNPFGPPQEGQDRYILFDVPRDGTGVVSLAQFQHAKLSEFVWHPSYAVGQSLPDPRLGADKLNRTAPPYRSSTEAATGGFFDHAIGWSNDEERSQDRDSWARSGRAIFQDYPDTDNLVYDLSFEVNRTLWDKFFLATGDGPVMDAFLRDPWGSPLPNGRLRPSGTTLAAASAEKLADYHRSAAHLMVDGAFNVNSTSVPAWRALLASTRESAGGEGAVFPRFLRAPGGEWRSGASSAQSDAAWAGVRRLTDDELDLLAEAIVRQVKMRGPFLSLSDFVNRRLVNDETGEAGPLQAAIDDAGLNEAFIAAYPLDNERALPDYDHPDNIQDSTRMDQTLKPPTKAWGLPGHLTQGDLLQVLGPALAARSDTFVVRAYGETKGENGDVLARAWCEAVVQRVPVPVDPDDQGLDPRNGGAEGDFGRRFVIKELKWLSPGEV